MISGQTIAGKYRINELLGSGGMASVWSATNIFTERRFAIKLMLPALARTPEAARRFLLEAKVSARVDHPNIVETIDVGQADDGSLFLVMELLTGESLDAALRRRGQRLKVPEFVTVMAHVARALAAAHKRGVVHRDLKPTNIFLHEDREGLAVPKVLDFGVSKFLEEDAHPSITVAGAVLGSPLYMSPEQASGSAVDGRTDVFAFGAILFEALCGYRAYEAANFNALIVAIATTEPKSIDAAIPPVPEALRALVRDCMKTDREARERSFDTIAERLAALTPSLEPGSVLPARRSSTASPAAVAPERAGGKGGVPAIDPKTIGEATLPPPSKTGQRGGREADGYSAPWATPSRSAAPPSKRPRGWTSAYLAGGGMLLLVVGLAVGVEVGTPRGSGGVARSRTLFVPTDEATRTETAPSAPSAVSTVPVISVDSLPVATKPLPPPEHGLGRLFIGAGPGSCIATVDSVKRGPTPLPPLDLTAGVHQLKCEEANGKVKSVAVTVQDGASARYRFTLD